MTDFKIRRGLHNDLFDANGIPRGQIEAGCWYLCTDSAELFLGMIDGSLKLINSDVRADLDLGNYVTRQEIEGLASEEYVRAKIAEAELNDLEVDLGDYYTKAEVDSLIPNTSDFVFKDDLPSVEGLASVEYVDDKVSSIKVPTNASELINDAGYLTTHQSIEHLATKVELQEAVNGLASEDYVDGLIASVQKTDLSNYYTKNETEEAISAAVANVTIPDDYITDEELQEALERVEHPTVSLDGYATEQFVNAAVASIDMPSIEGLATEDYVDEKFNTIDIPDVDLSGYYTKEEAAATISEKADKIVFTTSKFVSRPVGNFVAGEDIKGLTIAELFAKLLELSDAADGPEVPEIPDNPTTIVETIIANNTSMYQIEQGEAEDIMVEVPYRYISYDTAAGAALDQQTGFYQIKDSTGVVIESGYQHFSTPKDAYYIVALPDTLQVTKDGNVELQTWNELEQKWGPADYVLTDDYDAIVYTYNLDGITPPAPISGYKLWAYLDSPDTGNRYRFIIKE